MQSLVEERSVSVPPDIQERLDEELEQHKKSMELQIDIRLKRLRKEKETVEEAFEIFKDRTELTQSGVDLFSKVLSDIEQEIQEVEDTDPKDVMGDPDWA
jgi:hypothetical protein